MFALDKEHTMTVTADIVTAITGHHAELQQALAAHVDAVITAARDGRPHDEATEHLRRLLARDIVPHARAEEDVLYAAATHESVRTLVAGMTFEHQTILGLADRLGTATTAVDAAATAAAIQAVFEGHVRRENELLLPALAADPNVSLPSLLPVMEQRFAAYRSAAS
jgi:hemerythrin-like domain-containing protein